VSTPADRRPDDCILSRSPIARGDIEVCIVGVENAPKFMEIHTFYASVTNRSPLSSSLEKCLL